MAFFLNDLLSFKFLNCSITWGFPDSSVGKESAYNEGDLGSVPGFYNSTYVDNML